MRAFVLSGPRQSAVCDVQAPEAGRGQVVLDVEARGLRGTGREFLNDEMANLQQGHAAYPMRLGHEWCGTVRAVGDGVDGSWLGRRTTGDTMLGCGRCRRCVGGRQHVCDDRFQIGIRGGFPGGLAEQLAVPVSALHPLPETVDAVAGALVEPGGNALRCVRATALSPGERMMVLGPGTIGLLVAQLAAADGIEVHLMGRSPRSLEFARTLGFDRVWTVDRLPALPFDAVVDASNDPSLPALALDLVEPGGRVVYVGLSGSPSLLDTRALALKDVTAVGVLSASPGLAGTIE